MADDNGLELSDELLEGIAGGVISDTAGEQIRAALALSKKSGFSLEQAISSFMRGHSRDGILQEELVEYASQIWESLS